MGCRYYGVPLGRQIQTVTAYIYALLYSDHSVAYVGCAKDVKRRLQRHWSERDKPQMQERPSASWLRTLDEPPRLIILEEVPWDARGDAEARWVKHYRDEGAQILNVTDGGVGFTGSNYVQPPEAQERRLQALREARQNETEEQRQARSAAISRGRTGVRLSPEMAKRVGKKKGVPMSDEERRKRGYPERKKD